MHYIDNHSIVGQIVGIFYHFGIWHGRDAPTMKDLRNKIFYTIYYPLFPLSIAVGSVKNENRDESIFLAELAIIGSVLTIKLWILIWKQEQIEDLLHRVCIFSIRNDDDFSRFTENLSGFMKFFRPFSIITIITTVVEFAVFPFLGDKKMMLVKVGFPLDYENDDISFWIAHIFVASEAALTFIPLSFTITVVILLIHCSLRYQILGSEMTKMPYTENGGKVKITDEEAHCMYLEELTTLIETHLHLSE